MSRDDHTRLPLAKLALLTESRRLSACVASVVAVIVVSVLCPTAASAQSPRLAIKAIGAGTLGTQVGRTTHLGGGVTVDATPLVELFGEATLEAGHAYPADTRDAPSQAPNAGEPVFVIILNTPIDGIRSRVNAMYFGGIRLITPPDRTVQTFVDIGAGLAQYKATTTSYPSNLPDGYYTEQLGIWGIGGGLSTTVHDRWVLDAEYRWCHPWSEVRGHPFHRLQAGIGVAF